ncbi:hypothetical protein D9V29_01785 [Mycetocola manganoxydans]|uniref:Exo-alpha-sialidase n=1 Tax=Mycetocola manganoxydans TaxID=699879 RepID=A0A3L7A239_9MICO|nr:hypothetical protein D9V29_01785 [Mycetocola manganoxydans]
MAWRGVVGVCPDGSSALEYTEDGGASWTSVDPALETSANTLVRIVPNSATEANVVTLNGDCDPQLVGTFVAGEAWEDYSGNLGSYWYVDPTDAGNVQSPSGPQAAPCASVIALATRTESTAVLCGDQTVFELTSGSAEWSGPLAVPGAVALAGSGDGYIVAVSGQAECEGTSVVVITGGGPSPASGCLSGAVLPGETAVGAASDGTLWLWAGENFVRSTDGGATWS